MHYLFEHGRFMLYETEKTDKETPGTTGKKYLPETVLVFETIESEVEIGKEVAWASNESEAAYLAEDITAGTRNIPIDVQMILAGKIAQDTKNSASKRAAKKDPPKEGRALGQDTTPTINASNNPQET